MKALTQQLHFSRGDGLTSCPMCGHMSYGDSCCVEPATIPTAPMVYPGYNKGKVFGLIDKLIREELDNDL